MYPTPATSDDNIAWLYSELAVDWVETGLPSYLASNITRFKEFIFYNHRPAVNIFFKIYSGAFYSVLISPGVRLISLNMNYCPGGNYWL